MNTPCCVANISRDTTDFQNLEIEMHRMPYDDLRSKNRENLFASNFERNGSAHVRGEDATPFGTVICDRLTGFDVLVVNDIAVIVDDTASRQCIPFELPYTNHFTIESYHVVRMGDDDRIDRI